MDRPAGRRALLAALIASAVGCVGHRDDARIDPHADPHEEAHPVVAVAVADDPPANEPPVPRADQVRTIGHCDERERASGVGHITLAHINDMQARYGDRIAGKSRYAYVAGYLRALKEQRPETLVLDAGDDYEKGSLAELRSMGEVTRRMIQALPIDVRTIGNHDFSYGEGAVLRDVRLSAHPVLAANVRYTKAPAGEQPFAPFARVDVGCVRVGIVGVVATNYGADDQPTRAPFDGVFEQDDHYQAIVDRVVRAHRGEVDLMIALTHIGLFEDEKLATGIPGLDLVVGGHTEDLLREPQLAVHPDGSRTWVVQAGHYAETLGRADLAVGLAARSVTFDKYKIVDVDASLPRADDVAALADRLERGAVPGIHNVVAVSREQHAQGKGVADVVWRAARDVWGVDALLIGKDLFWDAIPAGPVTPATLYRAVLVQREPTGTSGFSSIYVMPMKGKDLVALRAKMIQGPLYELYLPDRVDPERTYRLAMEKRAMTYPQMAFSGGADLPRGRYAGELIDALLSYAKAETARGELL